MNYLSAVTVCALFILVWYCFRHFQSTSQNNLTRGTIVNKATELDPSMIDTGVLSKLGGDVSMENMPTLIDAFLKELDTRSVSVKTALIEEDANHLRIEVHSIKSCARTFGATALATKAAAIEQRINEDPPVVAAEINQMLGLLPLVRQVFLNYRETLEVV